MTTPGLRENTVSAGRKKIRNPVTLESDMMGTSHSSAPTPIPVGRKYKLYSHATNKNQSPFKLLSTSLLCVYFIIFQICPSYGGTCWLNVNKNGKCTALIQMGSTREDCCGSGILAQSASAAYSDGDLSSSSIFIMHIQGGIQCSRCKETCDNVKCPENKKCAVRKGHPKCVCSPNCASYRLQNGLEHSRGAVCGTDGQTYKNVCRLLKRSCRQKLLISVAYTGPCKVTCSNMNCPGNKQCLVDHNMIPHCVNCLERKCINQGKEGGPGHPNVCGVDGLTYPSICHIRQAACHKGKAIPIAYTGQCKKKATCGTIQCAEGQSCLTGVLSGKPRCVTCSRKRWCKKYQRHQVTGPICSNNGKTYKNWCDMMDDACNIGLALDTKHFGQCKGKDRLKNKLDVDY